MRSWLAVLVLACLPPAVMAQRVSTPPASFFEIVDADDREASRKFYKKYIDVKGLPVVAAGVVEDKALQRTYEIVTKMLAGRPDVLAQMAKNKMYLIIIGKDQVYTDMPEYRNNPDPAYMNERVRGTGGRPTSFGEENLLSLPIDRYDDESIGVHEFLHTIDSTLASIDSGWTARRNAAYRKAIDKGLWKNTYAAGNPAEFWAEVAQSYFDSNRVNNWNHGPVGTREQLRAYDPETYELVRSTFRLSAEQDWRYSFMRSLPNVVSPPARFKIDPFYTKFTYAREFPVVGRGASDSSLLAVNGVIRKMFAYRHDILKALINDGAKLVVLGRSESLSMLPEFRGSSGDLLARVSDYSSASKTMVIGEEAGLSEVVRLFARALYRATAFRPVDPNWGNRGRNVQQYELRVKRLDVSFDSRLKELYEGAVAKGLWKGTAAIHDREAYWVEGVLAYFDATPETATPEDFPRVVGTRELLRSYDAGLFELVNETMAYDGHVDWRHSP